MGGVIRTEGGSFTKQRGVDAAGGPSFTRMSEANNLSPRPYKKSYLLGLFIWSVGEAIGAERRSLFPKQLLNFKLTFQDIVVHLRCGFDD